MLVDGEGETRQGDERVAGAALKPRIAGKEITVVVLLADMELVGGINETMEEIVAWCAALHFLLKQLRQLARLYLTRRSGKDDTLTFLYRHLEISRHVEILVRGVATFLLFRILDATIPVGIEDELVFLAELHVEIRIAGIHACTDTIIHFVVSPAGGGVLVSELTHAAESHERAEAQCRCRMAIDEGVTKKDSVFIMLEHHFLF